MSADALASIDAIVNGGDDVDDALRAVVATLVAEGGCSWAGILFSEEDELILGPQAGTPWPLQRTQVPVLYEGNRVAELVADGCDDEALLEAVASRIAAHCLVGWDTAGEPWIP